MCGVHDTAGAAACEAPAGRKRDLNTRCRKPANPAPVKALQRPVQSAFVLKSLPIHGLASMSNTVDAIAMQPKISHMNWVFCSPSAGQ